VLLCGDIGGTNTTLALFHPERPLDPVEPVSHESQAFPGLEAIVQRYLATRQVRIAGACFGVAGPVLGERVATTNLPWVVDAAALRPRLGGVPVFLLNDLQALAHGVLVLPDDRLAVLNPGRPAPGNVAVIAAGTGLGEAGLVWDGARHVPLATEGGHADFAPRTEREIALLRYLLGRSPHVSWEQVVSGPGLLHCFEFLRDAERLPVPADLATAVAARGPGAISTAALGGGAPIAVAALDLFTGCYGAEAGNLTLKLMATAGTYVGGGIAPKILPKLQDGTFRAAFIAKGRFARLLEDVPVRVILDPRTALYGAARYAALACATR